MSGEAVATAEGPSEVPQEVPTVTIAAAAPKAQEPEKKPIHDRLIEYDSVAENPKVDVLADIEVPASFYKRMLVGIPVIDELFGGPEIPGIMPGSVYLFTGEAGAGKSTVGLQFAERLTNREKKFVLYNANEESKYMVKLRADRIGCGGARFALSYFTDVEELLQYIEDAGVEVVFIDSLQNLTYGKYEGRDLLSKLVKLLTRYGHDNSVTIFIIGQVTKAGVFQGPNAIKHDTDAHIHLSISKETGHRLFEAQKNRMGPAGIPYEFFMSPTGIDFKQLPPDEQEKRVEIGRAAGRREGLKEFIIEKMKEGEKISGYCFMRFNQECSGGFWRGMIEKAVKELQAEGKTIAETRDGPGGKGRTHVYIVQDPPKSILEGVPDDEE